MVDVSAVALSGLYAQEKKLAVAASNIAQANTPGFKAQDVALSSSPGGGVEARVVERTPATVPVTNGDGGVEERPNISLEEEVVTAQVATYSAKANLRVIQTQDKLNKYLLDIQA